MSVIFETQFDGADFDGLHGFTPTTTGGAFEWNTGFVETDLQFLDGRVREWGNPLLTGTALYNAAYAGATLVNTETRLTIQLLGTNTSEFCGVGIRVTDDDGYFFGYVASAEEWRVVKISSAGAPSTVVAWAETLDQKVSVTRYCTCTNDGSDVDFAILDGDKVSQATGTDSSSPFTTLGGTGAATKYPSEDVQLRGMRVTELEGGATPGVYNAPIVNRARRSRA